MFGPLRSPALRRALITFAAHHVARCSPDSLDVLAMLLGIEVAS